MGDNFGKFGVISSIRQNLFSQTLAKYTDCIQYGISIPQYIIYQIRTASKIAKICIVRKYFIANY